MHTQQEPRKKLKQMKTEIHIHFSGNHFCVRMKY